MNPKLLTCMICAMDWEVNPEDQDATLADALGHAVRRHPEEVPHRIIKAGTE